MITRARSSEESPSSAPLSWRAQTSSVFPASRSSSISPTQSIGVAPAARSAITFFAVSASVSPKTWRRSLWPTNAPVAPAARASGIEVAPVNAPFGSQCTSCAPTLMSSRPWKAWAAASIETAGGKNQSSRSARAGVAARNCFANSRDSSGPMCIFQFAAKVSFRIGSALHERIETDPGGTLPVGPESQDPAPPGVGRPEAGRHRDLTEPAAVGADQGPVERGVTGEPFEQSGMLEPEGRVGGDEDPREGGKGVGERRLPDPLGELPLHQATTETPRAIAGDEGVAERGGERHHRLR